MNRDAAETLGPYRVLSRLGSGGMGEVLLAYDPRLERRVAIKRIHTEGGDTTLRRARFKREARLAAGLAHPAIVQIFDLLTEGDEQHIVMEHIAGPSLRQLLDERGALPVEEGLEIAIAVARGLAYAHRHGVIHRDLKSENILLDEDAGAKITDFGIARLLLSEMSEEQLTQEGALPGTYRAMSPEQARGNQVDERSDLFSFGVLLYEMLAGQSPFLGSNDASTLARVLEHRPRSPNELVILPAALSDLIEQLMRKDPQRRPSSAGLVAEQLEVIARAATGPVTTRLPPSSSTKSIRTLLLTDLVHSTELVSALGDRQAMELNELHDRHTRALLNRYDGREIDKSDGFLLLFGRPVEAVRFALAYHAALADLSRHYGVEFQARVAAHLGEVFLRENPPDEVRQGAKPLEVEGLAKATTARVMALAEAGQTLLTRGAFDLAQRAYADDEIDQSLFWISHGLYQLKGLDEPLELCEVGPEDRPPVPPSSADGTAVGVWSSTTMVDPKTAQPYRRYWLLAGLVAGVGVALLAAWGWQLRGAPEPRWVVVLQPSSTAQLGTEIGERQAFVIRGALDRAVVGLQGLSPKSRAEIDALNGPPAAVARALAADEALSSSFTCAATTCRVEVVRLLAAEGEVVWSEQVEIPADRPLAASRALAALLRRAYPQYPPRGTGFDLQIEAADYALFLRLERDFALGKRPPELADIDQLAEIRQRAPSFLDAYLLEAELARRILHETHDPALVEHLFDLLDRGQRLVPDDIDLLRARARSEISIGRLEAADDTLNQLEVLRPSQPETLGLRASWLRRRGQTNAALELYQEAVNRRPSAGLHFNYALLASSLGHVERAREQIEAYLERAPGSRNGLSFLANLELMRNPQRAIGLYQELLVSSPKSTDWANLGFAQLLLGRLDEARTAFDKAAELAPGNPYYQLNQADVKQLLGDHSGAHEIYLQVLERLRTSTANDAQQLTVKAQVLAQLGQSRQAVEAVQEALRLEPESRLVAFEASLVYTLVGDRTAALVNATRALDQGYPARAFDLPWFDSLRDHPELRQRLRSDNPTEGSR